MLLFLLSTCCRLEPKPFETNIVFHWFCWVIPCHRSLSSLTVKFWNYKRTYKRQYKMCALSQPLLSRSYMLCLTDSMATRIEFGIFHLDVEESAVWLFIHQFFCLYTGRESLISTCPRWLSLFGSVGLAVIQSVALSKWITIFKFKQYCIFHHFQNDTLPQHSLGSLALQSLPKPFFGVQTYKQKIPNWK